VIVISKVAAICYVQFLAHDSIQLA